MSGPLIRLRELILNKPECVIDLPEWLLPSSRIDEYRALPGLAIVEIAGRDSVAAAIKAVEEEGFTDLIPTYVYTGTEYGPWSSLEEAIRRLSGRIPGVVVHELMIIGSPGLWRALNGRFLGELISRFGFYTPCVGCHLYLHSVRIPLSLMLGRVPIISGERESHNGDIKINQSGEVLNLYQALAKEFGVRLIYPLRYIKKGSQIKEILGLNWEEGKEQLGCVLSGNYRQPGGRRGFTEQDVKRYLLQFAIPCTKKIIESYVAGEVPDHINVAEQVLMDTREAQGTGHKA